MTKQFLKLLGLILVFQPTLLQATEANKILEEQRYTEEGEDTIEDLGSGSVYPQTNDPDTKAQIQMCQLYEGKITIDEIDDPALVLHHIQQICAAQKESIEQLKYNDQIPEDEKKEIYNQACEYIDKMQRLAEAIKNCLAAREQDAKE